MGRKKQFAKMVSAFICILFSFIYDVYAEVPDIRFEQVQAENALPQNMVLSIHQDNLGFLWLGTINGLYQYDGYQFKDYSFNDKYSIRINAITEDGYGNLWLSTYDGRMLQFNPETESYLSFPGESEDMLTSNITSIYETRDGLICLASNGGGVYFISKNGDDAQQINHVTGTTENDTLFYQTDIKTIVEDAGGNIWLGTNAALFKIVHDEMFKTEPYIEQVRPVGYPDAGGMHVNHLLVQDEYLWIGTQNMGIFRYNTELNTFESPEELGVNTSDSYSAIKGLVARGNYIWAGNAHGTLIQYDKRSLKFKHYKLNETFSGKNIEFIKIDFKQQLWIKTEAFGITRFDPYSGTFKHYQLTPAELQNLTDVERVAFLEDSRNDLWLGVHSVGVLYYDRAKDEFITYSYNQNNPASLSSNIVECLYEDREGTVWVGTNTFGKGLNRIIKMDPGFSYHTPVQYQSDKALNYTRSMLYDSKGFLWVGTKGGIVYVYDNNMNIVHEVTRTLTSNYSGHNVYAINEDPRGHIWLASKGGGVFKSKKTVDEIHRNYGQLTFERFHVASEPVQSRLNNNNAYDIEFDAFNRVWIATYGGGLNMLDFSYSTSGESYFFNTENSKLTDNKVRDLLIDNNRLWIGTTFGLNFIDLSAKSIADDGFGNITADREQHGGLSNNDIVMITKNTRGELWLATIGGGVSVLEAPYKDISLIHNYDVSNGLCADISYSITEDHKGNMWIGTEDGISRYNQHTDEIENFNKNIGLPITFFSENSCAISPQGDVLFGTVNGFYRFSSDLEPERSGLSKVYFTSLQVNGKEISPENSSLLKKSIKYAREVKLSHEQYNLAFEFALTSFKSPQSNQFYYKLEGFDDDWNFSGSDRKVNYTNLPPGKYQMHVKSAQVQPGLDPAETSLQIIISPSFWVSYKAFLLYAIILIIILLITFSLIQRINRLKNSLEVEQKVAESKLHFFANISHQLKTPLTLIISPIEKLVTTGKLEFEVKRELEVMLNNAMRLLRMINQLLEFRKVMNDNISLNVQEIKLAPFLQQVMKSFQDSAKRKKIQTRVEYDSETIAVWADYQKMDIVIFNLLSNAIKFTPDNGSITIKLKDNEPQKGDVSIEVIDTGMGIDKNRIPRLFNPVHISGEINAESLKGVGVGLSLSQAYVKLHQGNISVKSQKGSGTTFTIKLKKGKDHFSSDELNTEKAKFKLQAPPSLSELNIQDVEVSTSAETSEKTSDILLVENDADLANYIKSVLDDKYNVHIVHDGEAGLNKAREINPDLIVSDLLMPRMNGVEMTAHLKNDFETSHIPVLILSSKTETEELVKGLSHGAEGYISKPFNVKVLLSYISSILKQRSNLKSRFDNIVELKPDEIRVQDKDKLFIEQVIKYIEDNISDSDFNVEKLAGMMNISRTLFYKKIKSISGQQPIELIRTIRFKKAAMLLKAGDYNVTEVAYMLGYNDIRYFSTTFKKYYGKSPSIYQKEFREKSS